MEDGQIKFELQLPDKSCLIDCLVLREAELATAVSISKKIEFFSSTLRADNAIELIALIIHREDTKSHGLASLAKLQVLYV